MGLRLVVEGEGAVGMGGSLGSKDLESRTAGSKGGEEGWGRAVVPIVRADARRAGRSLMFVVVMVVGWELERGGEKKQRLGRVGKLVGGIVAV